jgi:glycine C-acetyltransferase
VFAKSLPMVYVAALSATLAEVRERPELRRRMWEVAGLLQKGLTALGYDIGDTASPITPVYVPTGSEQMAMSMMRLLREDFGIFVSGVTYPVVPPGVVMFRMIPTAAHSDKDVDQTIEAFLGAASSWAESTNVGLTQGLDPANPWKRFAVFLYCGKIYE